MKRKKDGVTKKFHRLYKDFDEALKQNNQEDIATLYEKINLFKVNTLLESYYKFSILAEYEKYNQNKTAQLNHLNKALRFSGSHSYFKKLKNKKAASVDGSVIKADQDNKKEKTKSQSKADKNKEQIFYASYYNKLILELDLGKISAALNSVNHLLLLTVNSNQHPSYQKQKKLLENFIQSDKPITTSGNIGDKTFWQHRLLRNQFSFLNIKGTLTKVDLRCSNKRHVYTINDKSTWNIPQNWQGCSVYVYGEDNASFTLVETNDSASNNKLALNK